MMMTTVRDGAKIREINLRSIGEPNCLVLLWFKPTYPRIFRANSTPEIKHAQREPNEVRSAHLYVLPYILDPRIPKI
jgi:hypothetical protein